MQLGLRDTSSFNALIALFCALATMYLLISQRVREPVRQRREVFNLHALCILFWSVTIYIAQTPFLSHHRLLLFSIGAFFWLQCGYLLLRLFSAYVGQKVHMAWTLLAITSIPAVAFAIFSGNFLLDVVPSWYGFHSVKGNLYPLLIAIYIVPPTQAMINMLFRHMRNAEGEYRQSLRITIAITLSVLVLSLVVDVLLPELGIASFSNSFMISQVIILYTYYRQSLGHQTALFNIEKAASFLFEGLDDGMLLTDPQGSIIQGNSVAMRILGLGKGSLYGVSIRSKLPELEDGKLYRSVPMSIDTSLGPRHLIVSTSLARDRGVPFGMVVVLRDQTELVSGKNRLENEEGLVALRYAEKAIREQENYLRTLLDNLPFEVWAKDVHGMCILQNRLDILRRGRQIGQNNQADPDSPRDLQQLREESKALEGEASVAKFSLMRHGEVYWYQTMIVPIQGPEGIIGIMGITMDMTELKHAELERIQFKERLLHANKMEAMGNLAGGIAHDFNNLLGSMVGYTELALDTLANESLPSNYLQEVLRSADRAQKLVSRILTSTRDTERTLREVSLGFSVQESIDFLRSSIPPHVRLEASISEQEIRIMADTSELHRLLVNLVTNSLHAMTQAGGVLSIRTRAVLVDDSTKGVPSDIPLGSYALIEVADTGHGIAPDKLSRIFDPFFTTKAPQEGTGLGLPIVRNILDTNNAFVHVESEPGMGCCFSIYWPMKASPEAVEPSDHSFRVVVVAEPALRQAIVSQCSHLEVEWVFPPSLQDLPRLWSIQHWNVALLDCSLIQRPPSEYLDLWHVQGIQSRIAFVAEPHSKNKCSGMQADLIEPLQCDNYLQRHLQRHEETRCIES